MTTPAHNLLRRRKVWLCAAFILAATLCAGAFDSIFIGSVGSYIDSQRFSGKHVFAMDTPQEFLGENDALAYARRTLEAEGYDLAKWQPRPEGHHTMSPNGERDWFLTRALDPRCGRVQFVNNDEDGNPQRFVDIDMSNDQVTTYIWMPK